MATDATTTTQDMTTMVRQGTQALEEGDLMGALGIFEQVVAAHPDRPEGHNNLGALYTALGENDKAESCFSQVIAMLPDNVDLRFNRGVVRTNLENFDGAREDFQTVLAARGDDADTLNNLGVVDFMQGRLENAARNFRACLKVRPRYTNALLNLVDVEQAQGHGPAAITLCEEAVADGGDIEIRRKLLELLSHGCREALEKASRVAETLVQTDNTPENRQEWNKLVQARSALAAVEG